MISDTAFSRTEARLLEFIRLSSLGALRQASLAPGAEASFQSLALELFGLQYEHVRPYRQLCEA